MRESLIEKDFVNCVKAAGGTAEKFSSPSRKNVPDRLVTFRKGVIAFVEVKSTGKKPTRGQLRDHKKRRAKGFDVFVIDTVLKGHDIAYRLARQSQLKK